MDITLAATLLSLLCAGAASFVLDARYRRLTRQVAIAVPANSSAHAPTSLRRVDARSRWSSLQRLIKYNVATEWVLRPIYVVLIGVVAGGALSYLASYIGLSPLLRLIIGAGAALFVMRALFGWQHSRFAARLFRQLPDALELVNSTVRAGLPIAEAFRIISRDMPQPTARQFALVSNDIALGGAPEVALEAVHRRTGVMEYGMFAVTLAVQMRSGGSLAETLNTLADTVRQRVALAARARALAGEVIFSARALTAAPFIIGGLLYSLNPRLLDKLFTDPTGQKLLAYGVCSVFTGAMVIRWMIRRETMK